MPGNWHVRFLEGQGPATAPAYSTCEGNLEKIWDANHPSNGQTEIPSTFYVYDELSRLKEVRQRWGGTGGGLATTAYGYDVQDHLTSVTDAELNTTTYTFSDRDLLTAEVSPVSGTTTHQYNQHGELTQTTDARGIVVNRMIDELDRVTLADYPGTDLDVAYTYDDPLVPFSKGRLTAITRDAESVDYAYDRFGRVTQDGALGYQYDQNGNWTAIEYPGAVTAVSTFDYADRPTSLTVQRPGEPDLPIASGATYEPSGPLVALDLGNGLTETRPYTNRYFPSAISVDPTPPLAGGPVLEWTYGTDHVGNIGSIADALTPANDKTYTYQDFQYFLTGGTGPWGSLGWTYDQIGNRLTETRDGVTDTYAYTSNGSGNTALLSTVTLALGGTRGYTYGPAGHLEQVTAPGNAVSFLSDAAGRLTRLERPAGDAQSDFLYDGRSFLRWAEASPYSSLFTDGFETGDGSCWTLAEGSDIGAGTATCPRGPQLDAVYSSEGLLHAVTHRPSSGPESTRYYLYLAGRPVAQLDVDAAGIATTTWLTTDHLGTPVLATDDTGSVLWQGGFEPFGADYSGAGIAGVDLRFPGQWDDGLWGDASAGAGVVYNLRRWYEAGLGRYTTQDPWGLDQPGGIFNAYSYAEANPLFFVDAEGLASFNPTVFRLAWSSASDCFFCLLHRASYGVAVVEEAAWLTPSGSGLSFDCDICPPIHSEAKARCPKRPPGSVLVHTHPTRSRSSKTSPQPSITDRRVADTNNITIVVVSPHGIWQYTPNSKKPTRVAGPFWWNGPGGPKERNCKPCDGIPSP